MSLVFGRLGLYGLWEGWKSMKRFKKIGRFDHSLYFY